MPYEHHSDFLAPERPDATIWRIAWRRRDLGLTAADLAAICGVSRTAVLKWESGTTENLKHDHLFLVADALNVRPRWLALGEGEKIAYPAEEAFSVALSCRDKSSDPKARKVRKRIAATFASDSSSRSRLTSRS